MTHQEQLVQWFGGLQKRICESLEEIETEFKHPGMLPGKFNLEPWKREDQVNKNIDAGGGVKGIMHGAVFEKAGVSFSEVYGEFSSEFATQIPGCETSAEFWASGVSVVVHPLNPFVPTVHMNVRYIKTTKSWFGGGSDLTPAIEFAEDTTLFHTHLKHVCDMHSPDFYPKFSKWCDEYFYLPHRKERRGVGGIFYDYLDSGNFNHDFNFTKAVADAFLQSYCTIVRRRMHQPWQAFDKQQQLLKRGRYVEFNLMYDRGTAFGLKTNGNVDAIFMSMPPGAAW